MKRVKSSTKKATKSGKASSVWTDEEKAAMRELAKERKAAAGKAEELQALLAAIAKMKEPDRSLAKRLHTIITANAPTLQGKTWYGMPAYANADGKVVCFFQDAGKFKARYATFGFQDAAKLDDGGMWATSFALKGLNVADEAKIAALLKKATS